MGGGTYTVDVEYSAPGRTYSSVADTTYSGGGSYVNYQGCKGPHPDVHPEPERVLKVKHRNPIIVFLDGTGSMGDSAKVAYDKAPMIWGQIEQQRFLADPAMSLAVVGDEFSDRFPVQVSDFAVGLKIHQEFPKLFLEGCGGRTKEESYEAAVHYVLDHAKFEVPADHAFAFIVGDEAPYRTHGGLSTKVIMDKFGKTWDTWLLHRKYSSHYPKDDPNIVRAWKQVLDPERIVCFTDMKAIADIILGIIAIRTGRRTLEEYAQDMNLRDQTPERIKMIQGVLCNVKPAPGVIVQSATDLADLAGLLALLNAPTVDEAVLTIDRLQGRRTAGRPNVAGLYGMLDYLMVDSVGEAADCIEKLLAGAKP